MKIGQITSIPDLGQLADIKKNQQPEGTGFGNILNEFIGGVNQDQLDAQNITKDFVTGGNVEIHEVMIAGEKAKTSLDLLMEIRNKAVDMYKELTKIQI